MIYTKPPVRQIQEEAEFKTELSPIKEAQFKVWYRNTANTLQIAPDPDDPLHYYDYRGYWEENPTQILERGDHFGDKFKTPGHPTFSDQSMYSVQQNGSNIAGGKWEGKFFVHSKDTDKHADRTDEYLEGTGEIPVYEGGDLDEVEVSPQKYAHGGQVTEYQQSGPISPTDSLKHQANKILQYEQLQGGPGGSPLPQYGNPYYRNMIMNDVIPEVDKIMPDASAMEKGEALDFVFNAGFDKNTNKISKDPRGYALQEYYRKYDPSKLDKSGNWSGRKGAPYSFDKEYESTIGKLSENDRRILMNKGRDWYYKNINTKPDGSPSDDYYKTWYGRIHNTNDYSEFNPKNPKFKYQESGDVDPPIEENMRIDPNDKVYQNLRNLIVKPTYGEEYVDEKGKGKRTGQWGRLQEHYRDISRGQSKGCLEGALDCNQYGSRYVDANATRHYQNTKLSNVLNDYDLPSSADSNTDALEGTGEYRKNKNLDAWEHGEAFVAEGHGQLLYDRSKDDLSVLEDLINSGNMPFGAMMYKGNPDDYGYLETDDNNNPINLDPNMYSGGASSHATSTMGWTPEGKAFIYDYGNVQLGDEGMYTEGRYGLEGINKVMVPNEYAKYTYNNIMAQHTGNMDAFQRKGAESFVPNENAPSYINNINKGLHIAGPVVKKEFGLSESVLKKLGNVVTGLAAQETNFNNQGDEDISLLRQAAISGESWLTNEVLKPIAKSIKNLTKNQQGVPDWMVEIEAYGNVEGDENKFKEEYTKLREKYPLAEVDSETDNPSVGPLSIKNLSDFSKYNLGLSKEGMYGPSIDDADEFSRGSQAALVHLAEDFTALKKHYDEIYKGDDKLTNNQLIDLATVAYNNKGKAYNQDFVDFYIKGKKMSDDYLSKVQALSRKYTPQEPQASLQLPERNERGGEVRRYQQSGDVGPPQINYGSRDINRLSYYFNLLNK